MENKTKKVQTTTIKINKKTLENLRKFEIHPRETHNQILERLIKKLEIKNG